MHQVKAMGAQKQGAKCRAAWSSGGLEQWNQAMKQKYPQADQWMEHWKMLLTEAMGFMKDRIIEEKNFLKYTRYSAGHSEAWIDTGSV